MNGNAYIFVNYHQAATFGHVGWGFAIDNSRTCYFGSTDHFCVDALRNPGQCLRVNQGDDNDWWAQIGTFDEMISIMRNQSSGHIWYHAYKEIPTNNADPVHARRTADNYKNAGWWIPGNTCLDHVYHILCDYGIPNLPWPSDPRYWVPNNYFNTLRESLHVLNPG